MANGCSRRTQRSPSGLPTSKRRLPNSRVYSPIQSQISRWENTSLESPRGANGGEADRKEYEEAKTRVLPAIRETLRQIQVLEGRLAELNETADTKSQQLARLGDPSADFSALRTEWKATHRSRGR